MACVAHQRDGHACTELLPHFTAALRRLERIKLSLKIQQWRNAAGPVGSLLNGAARLSLRGLKVRMPARQPWARIVRRGKELKP